MTHEVAAAIQGLGANVALTVADAPDDAIAAAPDAKVLIAFSATDHLLAAMPRLRWIQALGSGVDGFVRCSSLPPHVMLTNAAGLHAAPVSEAILAMLLALARRLPESFRDQRAHRWGMWMPRLLSASEVLVVGVGAIGAAVGAKCAAFGARVIGISGRADVPAGFSALYPRSALHERLAEADFVVLTAPLSRATAGLIDADALARMKSSAYVINAGRGGLVDEAALIDALVSKRIAGAALDVFATEPLPPESPLWDLPNVIVTPHRAGYHSEYGTNVAKIVVRNLQLYLSDRLEELINRVR